MAEFFSSNYDYCLYFCGVAFIILTSLTFPLGRRKEEILQWRYLAVFFLFYGLTVWLEIVAVGLNDGQIFKAVRTALYGISFFHLLEFGRSSTAALGVRVPGRMMHIPFVLLACAGGIFGIEGLGASVRYFMGFPGGLWAGWVIWRHRGFTVKRRTVLTFFAALPIVWSLAIAVAPLPAPFLPASILNEASFMSAAGFPVQFVQGILAIIGIIAAWRYGRAVQPNLSAASERRRKIREIIFFPSVFIVILAGWVFTTWAGNNREEEKRRDIIYLVKTGVAAMNTQRVARLTGTAADLGAPDYLRLKEQLAVMKQAVESVRFYYLMRMKGNTVIFLVDSEPASSPDCSPAGQVYEEITAENLAAMKSMAPVVTGPYRDRWGTWISAIAPVYADDGRVIASLGIDIEAARWKMAIARERMGALLMVVFLSSFLILFYSAQRRTREAAGVIADIAEEQSVLLNTINIQIWYLTDPETYGLVNDAHAVFLGRNAGEVSHHTLTEFLAKNEARQHIKSNCEVFNTGRRVEVETWVTDGRGELRLMKMIKTPKLDGRGRVEYVVCSAVDITDQKLMEADLRVSEERYRLIAENSSDVIWTMTLDGRFQYVSPSVTDLTGFTPEEVMEISLDRYIVAEYLPGIIKELQEELLKPPGEQIRTKTLDIQQYAKDGSIIDIEATTNWILNEKGEPIGIQGATRDIRERKKAEAELAKTLEEKGALLRELQHRVKNSLVMIVGLVDLESHRVEDQSTQLVLEQLRDRIMSLSNLYDLLYRSEDVRDVRLDQYLDQLCRSIFESYIADSGRITLTMQLSEMRVKVKSAIPLGLAVNEILTNALKYAFPDGRRGEITVKLHPETEVMILEVSDNGTGMPHDYDEKASKGMGSQLIRMMVQQLNGSLSVGRETGTLYRIEILKSKL